MGFEKYCASSQNPKGLAFGFTKKRLYMKKIGRKYIFLVREGHLLRRIDVKVSYIKFRGFEKH
jgi:hypothetical protein